MSNIPGRTFLDANASLQSRNFVVTLAQLNAGLTLVNPVAGQQIQLVGFNAVINGTFTTLTDVRLSDITSAGATANDFWTIAVANLGAGVRHSDQIGTNTLAAGFWSPIVMGSGLQIRKTGSAGAGGTSISISVQYTLVQPV